MELTQQNKTDLLEVVIILAMFFLIIVIYVPVAIWEEEEYYQDLSRYRMENVYDIESYYSRLTGEYNQNFLEAMSVVNATRDSTIADSLFIGEQNVTLNGKEFFGGDKPDIVDLAAFGIVRSISPIKQFKQIQSHELGMKWYNAINSTLN